MAVLSQRRSAGGIFAAGVAAAQRGWQLRHGNAVLASVAFGLWLGGSSSGAEGSNSGAAAATQGAAAAAQCQEGSGSATAAGCAGVGSSGIAAQRHSCQRLCGCGAAALAAAQRQQQRHLWIEASPSLLESLPLLLDASPSWLGLCPCSSSGAAAQQRSCQRLWQRHSRQRHSSSSSGTRSLRLHPCSLRLHPCCSRLHPCGSRLHLCGLGFALAAWASSVSIGAAA